MLNLPRTGLLLSSLGLVLALNACAGSESAPSDAAAGGSGGSAGSGGSGGIGNMATYEQVQAIVNAKCVPCHTTDQPLSGGMSLTDIRSVVGTSATICPDRVRIVAGEPLNSFLVDKLEGEPPTGQTCLGEPMPYGKPRLSVGEIATMMNWILHGAK